MRRLVLEAAYVGSRTIWLVPSGTGNITSLNIPSPALLRSVFGIDINNAADRTLLTSRIDSALAAQRGFRAPYVGYPASASVAQTLRPFPQFTGFWSKLGAARQWLVRFPASQADQTLFLRPGYDGGRPTTFSIARIRNRSRTHHSH